MNRAILALPLLLAACGGGVASQQAPVAALAAGYDVAAQAEVIYLSRATTTDAQKAAVKACDSAAYAAIAPVVTAEAAGVQPTALTAAQAALVVLNACLTQLGAK